jgi:hypothetical protein
VWLRATIKDDFFFPLHQLKMSRETNSSCAPITFLDENPEQLEEQQCGKMSP